MLNPTIKLDTSKFSATARNFLRLTRAQARPFMAQTALDVCSFAFEETPPFGPGDNRMQAVRDRIKRYMDQRIGAARRRGRTKRKAGRAYQLQRKHLILQARRGRLGLPGLYGQAMLHASANFSRKAQISVGFLKSLFIPILRGLNRIAKFKYPRRNYDRISVWPNSDGSGVFDIQQTSPDFVAVMVELKARLGDLGYGRARHLLERAIAEGIRLKAAKMDREIARLVGDAAGAVTPVGERARVTSSILSIARARAGRTGRLG